MTEPNHYHGPMYDYSEGRYFPFPDLIKTGPLLTTTNRGLVLSIFTDTPYNDARQLREQRMILGLAEPTPTLPFVVLAMPEVGYFIDYFLDGCKISDEGADGFLKGSGEDLLFLVCDQSDGLIFLLRHMPISPLLAKRLKGHVIRHRMSSTTSEINQRAAKAAMDYYNSYDLFRMAATNLPALVCESPTG
ncbi:MAG: hypothetical protein INR73_28405 [Williamsia sp.]|nr:hypothetical protein [Williamsia sp.]